MANTFVNSGSASPLCLTSEPHTIDLSNGDSHELRESISDLYRVQVQRTDKSTKIFAFFNNDISKFKIIHEICAAMNSETQTRNAVASGVRVASPAEELLERNSDAHQPDTSIHSSIECMSPLIFDADSDIEDIEGANEHRDIVTSIPTTSGDLAPYLDTDRQYSCELLPPGNGGLKIVLKSLAKNRSSTSTSTQPTDGNGSNGKLPPECPSKKRKGPFCCYKCKRIFSKRKSLKRHLKAKHFDRKRFHCKMCSKSFVQSGPLGKHMNAAHTKKTKYECEKCPEIFYYRDYLKYHLASKHGEGVYRCDVCNKICATKQRLQIHLDSTLHSNRKLYQCPIESCPKKFTQKPMLTRHIKDNHS